MSLIKRTGAIFVALFLTLTLLAPQTARADATTDTSVAKASTWIATTWKNDRAKFFSASTSADGIIALSAANKEAGTVREMLIDLKQRGPAYANGDPAGLAKMIITADTAGQNPHTFFGCERDLVAELQALLATDAGKVAAKRFWGPYVIAIALARSGEEVPGWIIDAMLANQKGGGFGYDAGGVTADPDYTAIGISAMNLVAGSAKNAKDKQRAETSIAGATAWSADAKNQKTDAVGNSYWETYSSSNSTGMLASALSEVGEDVSSPVRYLVAQQNTDGGWAAAHRNPGITKTSNVMATTQAVLGVIGDGYGTARSTQVPDLANCGAPVTPTYPKTVYNTPGDQSVNGRQWRTTCEKYSSQITRCFANIKATKVTQVGGRFVAKTDFVFNNLTYLPAPKAAWTVNPLGHPGQWTSSNGRQWKTECNTSVTGNGCRSYIWARVVENTAKPGQPISYGWVEKWEFNNMVQYS